ncbi:glycoside hydrolase family 3 N-terminal domain-containing protein [Streptomyces sp. NPDC090499]|uniref:glycoside hydrolase family 3 N-terminal domain-containing protein n=1 Tax=Streptomyces sp. NPDC090499 TaxID=3365965 RepID=UPI00382006A1
MTPADPADRPWQDPTLPVAERTALLLAAMTLEEKVAQLGSQWKLEPLPQEPESASDDDPHRMAPVSETPGAVPLEEAARHGLGQLARIYGSRPVAPAEGAADLVRRQHVVMAGSRLGIPAVIHEEVLSGLTAWQATAYPTPLAMAATFDPGLVERIATAVGHDAVALGVHQGLAPVLDVVRDYRWGRVEETLGEDPYLVGMMGAAHVRGLESTGLVATLKHFAGYSASRGARNHGPVSMGRRELLDVMLPPFEAALALGGARSVMNSYTDVDGVPAVADRWLLTELLRDQWGFTGTVVADYGAIPMLHTVHRTAASPGEAGAQALAAGMDVDLPDTAAFGDRLVVRVRRGEVPEALVDRAANRVLAQKVELGLLDAGWTPEQSVARASDIELDSAAHRALAREAAESSVVLLDAGTALPLLGQGRPAPRRVAVVGPCADDAHTLLGCYAFPNHVLPGHPGHPMGIEVPTVLEAVRAELPEADIAHAPGCAVLGSDRSGLPEAVAAAQGADVCVAVVGDLAGLFGKGSSGEGCDRQDLTLPGIQAELLEALLATGTPVVVVVLSGRPYALGSVHRRAAALVQAFFPGEEGAAAIAGVLSGRVNPSGHLPVQVPREPTGQSHTYLQPSLGGAEPTWVTTLDATPLFPFGHGGSYTTFEVSHLRLSATEVPTDGEVEVTVRLANTGPRTGTEVVQLYLRDVVSSVVRPLRQLAGFARVRLEPGEEADVLFVLHADVTSFTGADLRRVVEPGEIEVFVGTSAAELPCRALVRLTGPQRTVGHNRRLHTPVRTRRLADH